MSLTLPPYHYRRAWLRGFWVGMTLLMLLSSSVVLWIAGLSRWLPVALAAAVAVLVFGLVRPYAVSKPFRAWNLMVRYFSKWSAAYVSGVCYYTVIVPLARLWSARNRRQMDVYGWTPRGSGSAEPTGEKAAGLHGGSGQVKDYVAWARRSGNGWAAALLPFMLVLSLTAEDDMVPEVPADTYTLY